jgi:hypothetical protein
MVIDDKGVILNDFKDKGFSRSSEQDPSGRWCG